MKLSTKFLPYLRNSQTAIIALVKQTFFTFFIFVILSILISVGVGEWSIPLAFLISGIYVIWSETTTQTSVPTHLLKEDASQWNRWKESHKDSQIELKSVDLSKTFLRGIDLSKANLQGVQFSGENQILKPLNSLLTNSRAAVLDRFSSAGFIPAIPVVGAVLSAPSLYSDIFERTFFKADLRGANFREANLKESDLNEASLVKANLQRADLKGATLKMADLRETNLKGTDLRRANLNMANLRGANLEMANLQGADLRGANLEMANLQGADLQDTDLHRTRLEKVNAKGAFFSLPNDLPPQKMEELIRKGAVVFNKQIEGISSIAEINTYLDLLSRWIALGNSKANLDREGVLSDINNNKEANRVEMINSISQQLELLEQGLIADADRLENFIDNTMSSIHKLMEREQYDLADILHERVTRRLEGHTHSIHMREAIIHKLIAEDSLGKRAYYFILLEAEREQEFLQALATGNSLNLEEYGRVVASSYSGELEEKMKASLRKKYGFSD